MTEVTWFARLVTAEGEAAAGVPVQLQTFDLKDGWRAVGDATTGTDGRVRATAGDAGPASGPAPMLRLMEVDGAPAVLGGVPTVAASGSPPALTADFGEIVHIPDRFTALRAAPRRFRLDTTTMAGVATPAAARADVAAALAGVQLGRTPAVDGNELQARLSTREAELTRVQADNASVRSELETRTAAIRAVQAERDDARAQLLARNTDLGSLRTENAEVRAQLASGASALRGVQVERDDARAQLAQREADVAKLKLERDNVRAQLVDTEKRLAGLRDLGTATGAASVPPTAPARVSVGVFATRLGGEIDSAQAALKDRGFSLGPISVTARALVDDGGSQISFPGVEAMKSIPAAALSDIAIQYHPSPASDAAGNLVQVPDVRQLTESAARRVLASVGLGLEVTQGPSSIDPTCAEGQVMLQSPGAGERAARGTRVIAIFSRAEG